METSPHKYLIGYENKNLEITIKKPSGNPKMRTINQSLMFQLMKMQGNNKETHHLGDIYLEVFMSGSFDQASLIKNNLEMKRTFWNEVAMRRLIQTIWSPGLVDIKGGLIGIMYLRISLVLNLPQSHLNEPPLKTLPRRDSLSCWSCP
jgi:hypothetical protein